MPENKMAWDLWSILHRGDRPPSFSGISSLPVTVIHTLCEKYDVGLDIAEDILLIENVVYPKLVKRAEEEREKNKNQKRPSKQR